MKISEQRQFLPPIKQPSNSYKKSNSPNKISPDSTTKSHNSKNNKNVMNSMIIDHLSDMYSRLNSINDKFYERTEEINNKLLELDDIQNYDDQSMKPVLPNEHTNNSLKNPNNLNADNHGNAIKQYNFYDMVLDQRNQTFHNDKALLGSKYIHGFQKKNVFSRKKCRDLKDILGFRYYDNPFYMINQMKYQAFVSRFNENLCEIEKNELQAKMVLYLYVNRYIFY